MSFLGWQGGHWTPCGFLLVWAGGGEGGWSLLKMLCLQHSSCLCSLLQNCHAIQPFMDSSNVAPSPRLQLSRNCCSAVPAQDTALQELTDLLVSHCVSWQTGFNDSHIPFEDEFTLLILKDSSSWHSTFLQTRCVLMNKEESSLWCMLFHKHDTLHFTDGRVWPEEILELSTPD